MLSFAFNVKASMRLEKHNHPSYQLDMASSNNNDCIDSAIQTYLREMVFVDWRLEELV